MHVVTSYGTSLPEEVRLNGIFLTALTWRRSWYYYSRIRASSLCFSPFCGMQCEAARSSATTARPKSAASTSQALWKAGAMLASTVINIESLLDRSLRSLRSEYGICSAGLLYRSRRYRSIQGAFTLLAMRSLPDKMLKSGMQFGSQIRFRLNGMVVKNITLRF